MCKSFTFFGEREKIIRNNVLIYSNENVSKRNTKQNLWLTWRILEERCF